MYLLRFMKSNVPKAKIDPHITAVLKRFKTKIILIWDMATFQKFFLI